MRDQNIGDHYYNHGERAHHRGYTCNGSSVHSALWARSHVRWVKMCMVGVMMIVVIIMITQSARAHDYGEHVNPYAGFDHDYGDHDNTC